MENFRPIELHQVRDFSRKMSATFEFLRQNFLPLAKALVFIAGPPILISSFFTGDLYANMLPTGGRGPAYMMDWVSSPGFILQIIGVFIFYVLAGLFSVSVVNNYIKLYDEKKSNKIEVSEVWARVRSTFWLYLGTIVLIVVLVIVAYFAAFLIGAMFFQLGAVMSFIAVIGLVTAFMYLAITLSLIFPIRTFESISFFSAVSRAFYLIYGKWWSTFGLMIITSIIASLMSIAILIVISIIQGMATLHSTSTDELNIAESSQSSLRLTIQILYTVYFLISFLAQTLPLIAAMFQYFNLVERKEAKGLMSRIESFGEDATPAPEQHDEHY